MSSESGHIKTTLVVVESSKELPDMSNNDSSLGVGLLRRSNPVLLPHPVAVDIHYDCRLLVFTEVGRGRMEIG